MKYLISTPELDDQISEIRRKIRLSMNGIVSDQMKKNGIIYKINFGVSIPRIKQIAAEFPKNHDLAQRLWNLKIRETMIIATLIEPLDKFTENMAQQWVEEFQHIELVEQSTMNLFCKLDFANNLCLKWVNSDNVWIKITGYMLGTRIWNKLSIFEINQLIKCGIKDSMSENLHLYKAIAICLSRLCRTDKLIAQQIINEFETFKEKSTIGQQFILNEVKQELLFLDNL